MLNQIVLVGRILKIEEGYLVIKIPRNYKNEEGKYDVDFIELTVGQNISKELPKLKIDDVIGVKGRIETSNSIVVEKLTYLSGGKVVE